MICEQPSHLSTDRGARRRLLIAEPNKRYLAVLARRLQAHGYRIMTAVDAGSAIAELHRSAPDLVLSALRLRGTSGAELCRIIRTDPANRYLPLLLMVGRSDSAGAVLAFESGADAVFRKPFEFDVLAACVARHLDRADAVRQLLHDNAALDARVVSRAIEVGEIKARCEAAEAERERLRRLVVRAA